MSKKDMSNGSTEYAVMFGGKLKISDIFIAVSVALVMAFPSAILFSFGPGYSDSLRVPNMPLEQYRQLSKDEGMEFYSTPGGLREVSGIEKVVYLVRAQPLLYVKKSAAMFVALLLSAVMSLFLLGKSQKT